MGGVGAALGTRAFASAGAERALPNIVFILADDLGYGELGCYGQRKIRTPNLDRLAAQGTRFLHHYSGAPVCAPARTCLMTGKHLGHAPIRGNRELRDANNKPIEGQMPLPAGEVTVAEELRRAGYVTGAVGKWGLGPVSSEGDPNRQGFDFFYGYNCQREAHSYFPGHLWRNAEKVTINRKPVPGHARRPEGEVRMEDWFGENYAPDLMEAEAVRFIETHAGRPFFLYLPFTEPHVAMHPPRRLVESYPKEWDDKPYRGQCGYLPHPRPRAAYAAMVTHLDEHVGKVMDALDRLGLADNTLVVFTSDNGTTHRSNDPVFGIGGVDQAFFASTAGLRQFKGSVYEGGLKVPLIVRWPGHVRPGSVSGEPGYFADHLPTLCAAAGLKPTVRGDGRSLLPAMTGKGRLAARRPMVWVFPEYGGQVAVRIGDMKALRRNLATKNPGAWEVYDLARDPGETRDLAAERKDVIQRAEDVLRREMLPNADFPVMVPAVNA
jgi:arylsulfatase A-like enzyme